MQPPPLPTSLRDPEATAQLLAYDRYHRNHPWPTPFNETRQLGSRGDARQLPVADASIGLVVTHPPYHDLKSFDGDAGGRQLGHRPDYDAFLADLDDVWREALRVLQPGGRVCCVVGNVLRSAKRHGNHEILPLPHDIMARARHIGCQVLTPIQWHKVANRGAGGTRNRAFMGQPYQPNGAVSANHEYALMLRKPGQRRASLQARGLSMLQPDERDRWLQAYWTDVAGIGAVAGHPAPFPEEIAYRLIRLFSFAGDWVLDPFAGTGTTLTAARTAGRNGIGIDVVRSYADVLGRVSRSGGSVAKPVTDSATHRSGIYCLDSLDGVDPGHGIVIDRVGHSIDDVLCEMRSQDTLWLRDIWDHAKTVTEVHKILQNAVDANIHICSRNQSIDTRTDAGAERLAGFLSLTDWPTGERGRKRKLDATALARARDLKANGMRVTEIAETLNVHRATLYRRL